MHDAVTHSHAPFAGRYTIERELGRGGMATVYRARDLRHDRSVALKVLHPELGAAKGSERFAREIRVLAGLQHPHILPLFDSGEHEGAVFYVVPCVDGESLRQRIERERQLPLEEALRITREVADALDHAHRRGIIHRDIKPENVLLDEGRAIVADFGVARAVTRAAGESQTTAGMVVGTPAYMSPEQASGDDELDGRSDQYSLACVLYEMLAGDPPFSGTTPRATIARRFTEPPPSLRGERDVPDALDRAVRRALSPVPADRFPNVHEFAKALEAAQSPPRASTKAVATLGIPAVAAMAIALLIWWPKGGGADTIDPGLHAVIPFDVEGEVPESLDGAAVARYLGGSMRLWRDVRLVEGLRARDAVARHGEVRTLRDALDVARNLGAGRLIWGDLWDRGDSIEIRAAIYSVATGREERTARAMVSAHGTDVPATFANLSDSLALGGRREPGVASAVRGTRVREAFLRYEAGHRALGSWDLATAEEHFRAAAELDGDFAQASLMRAQVMAWAGLPAGAWRSSAERAVAGHLPLDARERSLAAGLLALAEERYPQACEEYRALVRRDSLDFAGWYGLGDCQVSDPIVERDARSPSGWRFRGSWHSGILAFTRAMKLLPSFHRAQRSFAPVPTDLFPVEPLTFRRGFALTPDTIRFAAEPGFESDTLSLVPRPATEVLDAPGAVSSASNAAAVAWSRRQLREVAETWVQAFPTSATAHEALGGALEVGGDLRGASRAFRTARSVATDRSAKVRLAADNVRLLVKTADWEGARQLADSTLSGARDSVSIDDAWYLAGLAALSGDVERTRALMELRGDDSTRTFFSRGQPWVVPARLARTALGALAYASFPGTRDSLRLAMRRAEEIIDASISSARRDETRRVVLSLPTTFGFWELGPAAALRVQSPTGLHRMQRAFARGDAAAVRAIADSAHARRQSQQTSGSLVDFEYHEALVLLAIGDTATAAQRLDRALAGLPNAAQMVLVDVHRAAAIPATLLLRARLAARAGDRLAAERWARGAVALWRGADGRLQQLLDEVRPFTVGAR